MVCQGHKWSLDSWTCLHHMPDICFPPWRGGQALLSMFSLRRLGASICSSGVSDPAIKGYMQIRSIVIVLGNHPGLLRRKDFSCAISSHSTTQHKAKCLFLGDFLTQLLEIPWREYNFFPGHFLTLYDNACHHPPPPATTCCHGPSCKFKCKTHVSTSKRSLND